jgi:hypothetical protein
MTTSDERRAMLALAKDPLFVCATENEALDRLAATVVRLIEEVASLESDLNRARRVAKDFVEDRDAALAKANQRIEALRVGLLVDSRDERLIILELDSIEATK